MVVSKSPAFIQKPPPGFKILPIIRGFQLTILGVIRALRNTNLRNLQDDYRQRLILAFILSLAVQFSNIKRWDIEPLLGPFVWKGVYPECVGFLDSDYAQRHPETHGSRAYMPGWDNAKGSGKKELVRWRRRWLKQLAVKLVLWKFKWLIPLHAFYGFQKVAGTYAALVVFGLGWRFLQESYMGMFLATFWGGRRLVRELLAPFFSKAPLDREQREKWFRLREGIMFGFGCGFYWAIKLPLVGIIMYGIAQASAAYLVTKVSEPLPLDSKFYPEWTANELKWTQRDVLEEDHVHGTSTSKTSVTIPGGWKE